MKGDRMFLCYGKVQNLSKGTLVAGYELEVMIPPETVMRRIIDSTDEEKTMKTLFTRQVNEYTAKIAGTRFRIRRRQLVDFFTRRSSFTPVFAGEARQEGQGTRIIGEFHLNPFAFFLVALVVALLALFVILLLPIEGEQGEKRIRTIPLHEEGGKAHESAKEASSTSYGEVTERTSTNKEERVRNEYHMPADEAKRFPELEDIAEKTMPSEVWFLAVFTIAFALIIYLGVSTWKEEREALVTFLDDLFDDVRR